jgi:signal transduction histidine kinase
LKINKYNIIVISIIALVTAGVITTLVQLLFIGKNNITYSILITFLIVAVTLFFYDFLITKRLKQSMSRFILQIKQGNFESKKSTIIQKYDFVTLTDIPVALSQIVGEIQKDTNEQKRYIENVSHELMTPIAIIRGKLELVIQSDKIESQDLLLISDILSKLERLKRVNESLVLLSKLDNNQFPSSTEVNLSSIIEEILNLFEDQIRIKELTIKKIIPDDFVFIMNENLAYILIKNVIKNAVNHSVNNGFINIDSNKNEIIISNAGLILQTSPNKLFERFAIGSETNDSIGLGLSIMLKICEISSIEIDYTHKQGEHTISLKF